MTIPDLTGKAGLLLCTRGRGTLMINGRPYDLRGGMATVVSPILQIVPGSCALDFSLLPLVCNLEFLMPNAQKIFSSGFPVMVLQHPVVTLGDEDLRMVLARKAELEEMEQLKARDTGSGILNRVFAQSQIQLMSATFMQLIGKYYADYINQFNRVQASRDWQMAAQFMLAVLSPLNTERRVGWYADQAHLSIGHFSARIRQVLGMSPQHWIEIITVNKAKSLLRQQDKSVKEIASELGFPEQFTFRKYFKEHAGVSPTDFRKGL